MKSAFWLCLFLTLSLATRCANYADVFVNGQIYFVDADCYSRMTRVQMVLAHPGTIIRHHDFENFPDGTSPHTTAPLDYLIALLAVVLKPFCQNYLDLAGAIVSPLCGMLTTAFLWYWSRELIQRFRKLMLLLVSLSPIVVHGTILGRPDHQSLLIFLMAVALGAELAMARTPSSKWSVLSGIAWALGIWTSLYEPLILMAAIVGAKLVFFRPQLFVRERRLGICIFAGIIGVALLVEGPHFLAGAADLLPIARLTKTDATSAHYLSQWFRTVGEMSPVWKLSSGGIFHSLLFSWVGFGLLIAPLLLIARLRDAKRSVLLLVLLVVTFALAIAQVRWGYFFALVFAMSLPWQLSLFHKPWLVWSVFILSLWPVLRDWEYRLFPDDERAGVLQEKRIRNMALRDVADHLRAPERIPMLAPWWLSPPLVYWAGQPAVAGSAHEGLAGIVDSARFYTAPDFAAAAEILQRRQVRAVVTMEPSRIVETSAALLFLPLPKTTVAQALWEHPHSIPPGLELAYSNSLFKVFAVGEAAAQ
ncbi:MAG: dolichyl-phosphooligosaccharide-protein glycotransferase [Chthoniobacter sp.]|jgi:hypothetical protein|nr:dolichyl-phosphooligosaccharide-protein glycotransferase [Chthoniobacter sp.]